LPFSVIRDRDGQRRFRVHRGAAQAASRAHALPPPGPGTYAVLMATDAQQISGSSGSARVDDSAGARILAEVTALRGSFDAGITRPLEARLAQLEALRRGLRREEPALARALAEDLGKSRTESALTEIGVV